MIVCPVCEHAQAAATECEVCGRAFGAASVGIEDVPLLDVVEPTRHGPVPVASGTFAELEPTAHTPAPEDRLGAADVLDLAQLEATRTAPVDVDAPRLPDVEPTAQALPGDGPTVLPAFPICRYCRTPALPEERLCSRCGMRLPVLVAARSAPAADAGRICGCGARVRERSCPACGARGPG